MFKASAFIGLAAALALLSALLSPNRAIRLLGAPSGGGL